MPHIPQFILCYWKGSLTAGQSRVLRDSTGLGEGEGERAPPPTVRGCRGAVRMEGGAQRQLFA